MVLGVPGTPKRPKPLGFLAFALIIGVAYDEVVANENPWSAVDYALVGALTLVARAWWRSR